MTTLITHRCPLFLTACKCENCMAWERMGLTSSGYVPLMLAVAGIVSAIHAWREWMLEAQREYIRVELHGMMARQSRYIHELEQRLIDATCAGS